MSKRQVNKKLLKNSVTGAVFPYSERLAKNKNMKPVEGFEQVDVDPSITPDDSAFDVKKAKKDALIEFALNTYGVMLEDDQPVAELRKQVQSLIDADSDVEGGSEQDDE